MLNRVLKFLKELYFLKTDPSRYAKMVGVNLKGRLFLYGARKGMFGSEPWLITTGNNVHVTGNCQFINHDGGSLILRDKYPDLELTFPIIIGNNVYIGYGSTILAGVTIGDNVIIGAGSIVNKSIPSNSVAAGVPCKVIKSLDDYTEKALSHSLKVGHLKGEVKDKELKKIYNYSE